jgi:hypothetical protein
MRVDPDGRFAPIVIAAAAGIGAALNVASNWQAIASSPTFVAGLGRALGFAVIGGASGWASLYNPAAGGAIQGVGNALLGGAINGDSFSDIVGNSVIGGITGAATSFAGAQLGGVLAPYISKAFSNVTSPVLQHALGGLVGGAAVGGVLGGTIGAIAGENVWASALSGAGYGAASGLLGGIAQGFISAKEAGFNPWNGRNLRADQPEVNSLDIRGTTPIDIETALSTELVAVRHHTSPAGMKAIRASGHIRPSRGTPHGADFEVHPFLPPARVNVGQDRRGAYVEFQVPRSALSPIPGYMGGTGNTGRIVTGGPTTPLKINQYNPRYVRWKWWPW